MAKAALRSGAGLVTIGCPPAALQENAARLDAVMLHPIREAADLAAALEDSRINAVCLGPGLGVTERTRAMVQTALNSHVPEKARRSVVLDADALTAFSDDPGLLFAQLHTNCVLTPHAGEFARLFPDIAQKLDAPARPRRAPEARFCSWGLTRYFLTKWAWRT